MPPAAWVLFAGTFVNRFGSFVLVFFQGQVTLPLHVRDAGFSYAVYGALISLNGAVIVLLELPLTAWTQRLPPRPVMATGLLLEAGGFAPVAVAFDVPLLAFTVVVWTL